MPTREELQGLFNAEFPDVEHIQRVGFSLTRVEPEAGPPRSEPPAEPCPVTAEIREAIQLWDNMHRGWQHVLSQLELTAQVRQARAGFTSCLKERGVPSSASLNEVAFLSHVDRLQLQAWNDHKKVVQLGRHLGTLYTHCGKELFDLRERLRAGDRRSTFLKVHADELAELTAILAEHTSVLARWEAANRL